MVALEEQAGLLLPPKSIPGPQQSAISKKRLGTPHMKPPEKVWLRAVVIPAKAANTSSGCVNSL
jgi:hypothetical protein